MPPHAFERDAGDSRSPAASRALAIIETLLVWAIFALHAGWPIPDVNESHYLVKAKHFWNPDWAAGDFFLQSPAARGGSSLSESHFVFYVLTGWPTRFVSLYAYAALGRALCWLFMAYAWRRLSVALLPAPWLAPLSAALFVALSENFQMAGEWVVGGLEAKELAYPFVFLALAAMVAGRYQRAMLWTGVASAIHILVGGWVAVVIVAVWLGDRAQRPAPREFLKTLAMFAPLALIGALPALALDWGADRKVVAETRYLYVFQRLPHHLLPGYFPIDAVTRFTLAFGAWVFFSWRGPGEPRWRRLQRCVLYAVAIAAAGVVLFWLAWNHPALEAQLMRYYWFRLADAILPLGLALAWLGWAATTATTFRIPHSAFRIPSAFFVPLLFSLIYLASHGYEVARAARPRSDAASKVYDYQSWLDVCAWVERNTPADALFITPRGAQTFKWRTGRAEVVNWKDLPQDARGIAEWWRRMTAIYGRDTNATNAWLYDSVAERPAGQVRELARHFGADYIVAEAYPPLDLPRLYANKGYAVYAAR